MTTLEKDIEECDLDVVAAFFKFLIKKTNAEHYEQPWEEPTEKDDK
jgi:hypothetical protein